jgi:hypothetical protein
MSYDYNVDYCCFDSSGVDALKIAIGAGSSAAADTLRYISTDNQIMLEDNEEKSD